MSRTGRVPGDWREAQIASLADVATGGTPSRDKPEFWGGDIPWMSSGEIHKRRIRAVDGRITDSGLRESNARWLPAGTVLLAMNGQGKTRGTAAILEVATTCNQSIAGLVVKEQHVVPEFLFVNLASRYEELRNLTGDGARTGLNLDLIRGIRVLLPPLPEQRKIAEILSSVDEAIERTEAVIERVRDVKRALAQELLTRGMPGRHTRYKQTQVGEIPEEWEVVRLGEVIDGVTYGTSAKCHIEPIGVPVLRIPNVASGEVDVTDLKYAEINGDELAQLILRGGDLLVVRTNGNPDVCGRFALVRELTGQWSFASYLLRLRPLPGRLLPEFLELALNSRTGREQLRGSIRTSAGNYNLSATGLANARLPLPSIEEQSAICSALSSVRFRSELETATLNSFGELKSELARALLCGDLRVTGMAVAAEVGT